MVSTIATQAGVQETPFFFDVDGEQLFAVLHRPSTVEAHRAVVICHALAEEKLWSHRVLVDAARRMARAGCAVLRFDCRGEGDSDREFEQCGLGSRVDDAVGAANVLLGLVPTLSSVTMLGHRLGAWLAAVAAVRLGDRADALVLWDPIIDGNAYMQQMLRSVLTAQMALYGKAVQSREQLVRSLHEGGTVTIDGYAYTAGFFRELIAMDWRSLLKDVHVPGLLLEVAGRMTQSPSDTCLEVAGVAKSMEARVVAEAPFWRETKLFHQRSPSLTSATLDWLGA